MIAGLCAWFMASKVGRWLAGALVLIVGIGAALLVARRSGVKAAQAEMTERRARAARVAKGVRDEVDAMGDDALRDSLGRWVRDDER